MNVSRIEQGISDLLGLILIVRLLTFRLHKVYRVFCVFLGFELLSSSIAFLEVVVHNSSLDYRITWITLKALGWVLSLWMVYELLGAVLSGFKGILKASRFVLNSAFLIAIVIALLTAKAEYVLSGLATYNGEIDRAVGVAMILERVIATVAVIVLLLILGFILWFPVELSRNLTFFSFGFVVYFASKAGLILAQSYWSHQISQTVSDLIIVVLAGCFAYWIALINPEGELKKVRVGHAWDVREQSQYLGQLEAINAALLRTAKSR